MTAPWGGCCLPTSPSLQPPKASDPKLGESSVPSPSWVNRPAPAGGEGQGWGGWWTVCSEGLELPGL